MSPSDREVFEVYAVRYATLAERTAHQTFIMADPHDGPWPMDYFVWAAIGPDHTYVIDTGFDQACATRRGRALLRSPADGLEMIGVDVGQVEDVIVTHLHYDHIGNFDLFPRATFHLQDKEMHYATGRHMCEQSLAGAYEVDHIVGMVRQVYDGRVAFHDGDAELSPGFSVHFIGGHTMGMQCARVWTRLGWLVLASDASHYYANMERANPFPLVFDVGEMLQGFHKMRGLAEAPRFVIPGHDPLVMARYAAPAPNLEGIAVRLDAEPDG